MISIDVLLNMICTDAIEGGSRDDYSDEFKNREYIPPMPERREPTARENALPPIRYDLELIEREDGTHEWVE